MKNKKNMFVKAIVFTTVIFLIGAGVNTSVISKKGNSASQIKKSNPTNPIGDPILPEEEIGPLGDDPFEGETGDDWTLLLYYSVDFISEGNGDRDRDQDRDSSGDGTQGEDSGGDGGSNGQQTGDRDGSQSQDQGRDRDQDGDQSQDQDRDQDGNGNYPTEDPSGNGGPSDEPSGDGNDSPGGDSAPKDMTQTRTEDDDSGYPVLSLETSMEIEIAAIQEATTPSSNGINIFVLVDKVSENGTSIFKIEDGKII